MELLTGSEKHSLPLCVYVMCFGKASHIYNLFGHTCSYSFMGIRSRIWRSRKGYNDSSGSLKGDLHGVVRPKLQVSTL